MKRTIIVLIIAVATCLSGCSTQPKTRNTDLSDYIIANADDISVEGHMTTNHNGDINISHDENYATIRLNNYDITLNETLIDDIADSTGFTFEYDISLNGFTLLSNNGIVATLTADKDTHVVTGIDIYDVSYGVSYAGITDASSKYEAISVLGEASSSAESDITSNYKWVWNNSDERIVYQMYWHNDTITQISLQS